MLVAAVVGILKGCILTTKAVSNVELLVVVENKGRRPSARGAFPFARAKAVKAARRCHQTIKRGEVVY